MKLNADADHEPLKGLHCAHAMPWGATLKDVGGVDFRLWAPSSKHIDLVVFLPSGEKKVYEPCWDAQGWREIHVPEAGVDTLYQWRVRDGVIQGEGADNPQSVDIPDPASRFNPEGPHGPSRVVDPRDFVWDADWQGRPWKDTVLYELHVGAFTPEGTFSAAQSRLKRLAELGITAIELMPVADFPGHFGWGYDGVLPFAPHAAYGEPQDLKNLIQTAHRLGMMVFLDVVYNHFGPDGNYLHLYAPKFFSDKHQTPWGAALNFDDTGSEWVRRFFIDNALYWLQEYRFDGLRLDAVHAIKDDTRPDVIAQLGQQVREKIQNRKIHLILENENNGGHYLKKDGQSRQSPEEASFTAQWNDDFHHVMHVLLAGETAGYYGDYEKNPTELLGRSLTQGFIWQGAPREQGRRQRLTTAPAQPLSAMVNCLTNHDQSGNRAFGERLFALIPPPAKPLAMAMLLLTPATPMLFFGDEFDAKTPFLYFADWQGDLKQAVTQGRLREFGHMMLQRGQGIPPPCEKTTFEASRLDWVDAVSQRTQAWRDLMGQLLKIRLKWFTANAEKLAEEGHVFKTKDTALAVRWRYANGAVIDLCANMGTSLVSSVFMSDAGWPALQNRHIIYHTEKWHADSDDWQPWSACWTWGQESTS